MGNNHNHPNRLCIFAALLVAVFLFGGCGYKFRAGGEPLGTTLSSIAIPLVPSPSTELGFEAEFTKILREEFISRARVPLVSTEQAQAVLMGRIRDIMAQPLAYDTLKRSVDGDTVSYSVTSSRRLTVRLDMKMVDQATGRVIWSEEGMEEQGRYNVGADPTENRDNQRRAVERIAGRLARRIYLKTMERF